MAEKCLERSVQKNVLEASGSRGKASSTFKTPQLGLKIDKLKLTEFGPHEFDVENTSIPGFKNMVAFVKMRGVQWSGFWV